MDGISLAVRKHGGFWAFGKDQFKKAYNPKLKYVSLGAGLYAPKKTYKNMIVDIEKASMDYIKKDLENNSVKEIIWRELQNHEAQFSDTRDTFDVLEAYGITIEEINKEYPAYMEYCVDNDLF